MKFKERDKVRRIRLDSIAIPATVDRGPYLPWPLSSTHGSRRFGCPQSRSTLYCHYRLRVMTKEKLESGPNRQNHG
jgi:hypothetical protein